MKSAGAKAALVLLAALAAAASCRKAVSGVPGDAGMPVGFLQAAAPKSSGHASEPTGPGPVAARDVTAVAAHG